METGPLPGYKADDNVLSEKKKSRTALRADDTFRNPKGPNKHLNPKCDMQKKCTLICSLVDTSAA